MRLTRQYNRENSPATSDFLNSPTLHLKRGLLLIFILVANLPKYKEFTWYLYLLLRIT